MAYINRAAYGRLSIAIQVNARDNIIDRITIACYEDIALNGDLSRIRVNSGAPACVAAVFIKVYRQA